MKIAYISYEYPPDTALGGIGTYVYQAANLMAQRGHNVVVFCGSIKENSTINTYNLTICRVFCTDRVLFNSAVLSAFGKLNQNVHFDIIESGEYMADGYLIQKKYSDIPFVVKLHTPGFLVHSLSISYDNWFKRIRFMLGGILKFQINKPYWIFDNNKDDEYFMTKNATAISSPSVSLGNIVAQKWKIRRIDIENLPYPYIPSIELLNIPIQTKTNTITFFGRLEIRKGVIDIAKAIPTVLKQFPNINFRFIGQNMASPKVGVDMKQYLKNNYIGDFENNVSFIDSILPNQIPQMLAQTDICLIPSIWENFPNVCLESMSAGRAIIATNVGGIKDMLTNNETGLLIPPLNSKKIAESLIILLKNGELRYKLGINSRKAVLNKYNGNLIAQQIEKHYENAIFVKKLHFRN